MTPKKSAIIQLLAEHVSDIEAATDWLKRTYAQCGDLIRKEVFSVEDFDHIELLTSRFSRVCDMLINKVYRSIDRAELNSPGTLIDVLNRCEKRGIIDSVDQVRELKELRNQIVHEYANEVLPVLFRDLYKQTPRLIDLVERAIRYARQVH
jgi:uncharacterized protein YutE (UPF0331/DUF86 family)